MKTLAGYAIGATNGGVARIRDFYSENKSWVGHYFVVEAGRWLSNRTVLISPFSIGRPRDVEKVLPVSLTREK
jgi:hypothetical protein